LPNYFNNNAVSLNTDRQQRNPNEHLYPSPGDIDRYPAVMETPSHGVKNLHDYLQTQRRYVQIEMNEANDHTLIKVVDSETCEVVRLITPEDLLATSRYLLQTGNGGRK
jgi:uncharacterized FlaG/YvyC family protein